MRQKCWFCELDTLDGHLTCGMASCSETTARAEAHSARRGRSPGLSRSGSQGATGDGLERRACGAVNVHMNLRCGLQPEHPGDVHRSGQLVWRAGERPRQADEAALARLGPVEPQTDGERLRQLTEVLLTARAQMLGLGEGLRKALAQMPRAIDQQAVKGLVEALSHIVKHLDSYKVAEGDTEVGKGSRLGADRITAGKFSDDGEGLVRARRARRRLPE